MMDLAVALSGMLMPGLGHILLGHRRRGLAFLLILSTLFAAGVFLDRDFYNKFGEKNLLQRMRTLVVHANAQEVPESTLHSEGDEMEGAVDRTWKFIFIWFYPFFVGVGNYAAGMAWSGYSERFVMWLPHVASPDQVPVTIKDIGYCFALLAGLLNLLVMMDAHDIAVNIRELARRKAAKA